jgi:hypothetical protein
MSAEKENKFVKYKSCPVLKQNENGVETKVSMLLDENSLTYYDANSYSHLENDYTCKETSEKIGKKWWRDKERFINGMISILAFSIIFAMCFVIMFTLRMSDTIDERVRQKYRYEYSTNVILTVMTNTSTVILDTGGINS